MGTDCNNKAYLFPRLRSSHGCCWEGKIVLNLLTDPSLSVSECVCEIERERREREKLTAGWVCLSWETSRASAGGKVDTAHENGAGSSGPGWVSRGRTPEPPSWRKGARLRGQGGGSRRPGVRSGAAGHALAYCFSAHSGPSQPAGVRVQVAAGLALGQGTQSQGPRF